ncbi:hypothetical protein M758_2G233700, partial [Ceratodon purpureus]
SSQPTGSTLLNIRMIPTMKTMSPLRTNATPSNSANFSLLFKLAPFVMCRMKIDRAAIRRKMGYPLQSSLPNSNCSFSNTYILGSEFLNCAKIHDQLPPFSYL